MRNRTVCPSRLRKINRQIPIAFGLCSVAERLAIAETGRRRWPIVDERYANLKRLAQSNSGPPAAGTAPTGLAMLAQQPVVKR